jgi:enolase
MGAPLIKSGAPARGERLAKYNRLLEIEWEMNNSLLQDAADTLMHRR